MVAAAQSPRRSHRRTAATGDRHRRTAATGEPGKATSWPPRPHESMAIRFKGNSGALGAPAPMLSG